MSFTDQKPRIATERDVHGNWSCGKDGKYFRCYLCGHKFVEGNYWRFVFDVDTHFGNFMVCKKCDGKDVRDKWKKNCEELKQKFWWAIKK